MLKLKNEENIRKFQSFPRNFKKHTSIDINSVSIQNPLQKAQYTKLIRNTMALGKNCGLGLVRRTSSFGRKRILILNETDTDSIESITPTKKRSIGNKFSADRSFLEALPQDVLIRVLCGVEHDDLKRLVCVSKPIKEAALIAKKLHFEYSTPKKVPAFRCAIDQLSLDVDEMEAPNAPKQLRVARSQLDKNKLAELSVALFVTSDERMSRRNLFSGMEF